MMKGSFKSQAYVLKKRTLLNHNILVDLFTLEYGHIKAIAYGAKKLNSRRGPHLETGNLIKIEAVKKKDHFFLQETILVSGFSHIKEVKAKSNCLYLFLYFLEHLLPEMVREEEVFNIFTSFLVKLSKESDIEPLKRHYLNNIIIKLGYSKDELDDKGLYPFIEDLIGEKLPRF